MAFDLAQYQRDLDEIVGAVSPNDAPANRRLDEGDYPYPKGARPE